MQGRLLANVRQTNVLIFVMAAAVKRVWVGGCGNRRMHGQRQTTSIQRRGQLVIAERSKETHSVDHVVLPEAVGNYRLMHHLMCAVSDCVIPHGLATLHSTQSK